MNIKTGFWLSYVILSFLAPSLHQSAQGQPITDFEPKIGQPGIFVRLDGPSFPEDFIITFNGVRDFTATRTADTQIIATVPDGATSGPIAIQTAQGTFFTVLDFIVLGTAPYIVDFTPKLGPAGTLVTITGYNFTDATGATFNGISVLPGEGQVTADTQIHVLVPPGATTGPISVTSTKGTGVSLFNFFAAPVVSGFSPTNGAPGDTIQLLGLNFTGALSVKFNDLSAPYIVNSLSNITAIVPAGALTGPISVAAPGGVTLSTNNFIVAPLITSFSPLTGGAGIGVDIFGANLTNASSVKFGGVTATFAVLSSTNIRATTPGGVVSGLITVVTPGGTNNSSLPFYVAPRITGFAPAGGPIGSTVTISGLNFLDATAVKFNGLAAPITSLTQTQIVVRVPTNAASGPIGVTAPAGTAATSSNFVVFTTSDLVVGLTDFPDPVSTGDTLTYTIGVTNRGPKDATSVFLTNTLPTGVNFISALLSQGNFSLQSRLVSCDLGNMVSGASASVVIKVIPFAAGNLTNTVTVRSTEPDSNPGNNTASVKTVGVQLADPTLTYSLENVFFEVSWPKSATDFVLQYINSLSSTNWLPNDEPPIDAGNRYLNRFNVTTSDRKFFRLRKN